MTDLYEESYPPSLWAPVVVPATTGVAGELGVSDGTWLPPGSTPPTAAGLVAGVPVTVTASPATAWTGAMQIICSDDKPASWNGTAWESLPGLLAVEPARAEPDVDPGAWTVAEVEEWVLAHQYQAQAVLDAELARTSPRSTLVAWLESHLEVP